VGNRSHRDKDMTVLLLLLSVAAFVYLVYAILRPEQF
jgi:K+-transporting ATPase KdpF subunit